MERASINAQSSAPIQKLSSGSLAGLFTICVIGWCGGCLNLRGTPLDLPPETAPAQTPAFSPTPQPDASLSGALDGPTLRLALRDLAVILDTLGRLEQVRPDLKPQMLRELADADAATAAAVVSRWRARLPELQAHAERVRLAALESNSHEHADGAAASDRATGPPSSGATVKQLRDGADRPDNKRELDGTARVELAAALGEGNATPKLEPVPEESPDLPSWDDLLDSLVALTRDRADELGPNATRARMQLALLELVRRSQDGGSEASLPDAQLWIHLNPAIQYCFGNAPAGQLPTQEVVRSLQVATELLRGPGRFQVRGLAFCSRIRGFGNIDRVQANTFGAGQAVLLYSEVEHFFSDPVPGGFRTRISSVIDLLDANGRLAWSQDFGVVEDTSTGPRRDYFMSYRFHLPHSIKAGVYSVRLTLCDELANRSASGAIALSIR
jgi:hypothetical protein